MSDIDPEKLESELAYAARAWSHEARGGLIIKAARAHLATLPKAKEVEVWHVEFYDEEPFVNVHLSRESAEEDASDKRSRPAVYSLIRVIGPHKQRVPA